MFKTNPIALRAPLKKVLMVTVLWVIIGSLQFGYEQSIIATAGCDRIFGDIGRLYLTAVLVTTSAGLIGGSIVVFFFEKWIRIWPYWKAGIGILTAFTIVHLFTAWLGFSFAIDQLEMPAEAEGSEWNWFLIYLQSPGHLRQYVVWFIIVNVTLLFLVVYDKYGPGTIRKLLLGRYFKPKEEERVFMFLDLRSSTTIAEDLGERKYFQLLRDIIQDATLPILASKGEIYQYVGDEIVISWPTNLAQRNTNCLNCFFAIRNVIESKSDYYRNKYGVVPVYKAGLHYGSVIAGEIGVVKRDITYSGDVLNTTARIQSKCNEFGVDILLSKHLLDRLQLELSRYIPRQLGTVPLRGKKEGEFLYTLLVN